MGAIDPLYTHSWLLKGHCTVCSLFMYTWTISCIYNMLPRWQNKPLWWERNDMGRIPACAWLCLAALCAATLMEKYVDGLTEIRIHIPSKFPWAPRKRPELSWEQAYAADDFHSWLLMLDKKNCVWHSSGKKKKREKEKACLCDVRGAVSLEIYEFLRFVSLLAFTLYVVCNSCIRQVRLGHILDRSQNSTLCCKINFVQVQAGSWK